MFHIYDQHSELGTNSIFEYIDGMGNLYVIFNLWNLVSYKVFICSKNRPVLKQAQYFELALFHFDGTKSRTPFGVFSLNPEKGYDVLAESIDDGFKRLHRLYLQQLQKLMTTLLLSINILKNQIDLLVIDLKKYKNNLIKIVDYEDRKRIITLITLMKLQEYDYNYSLSFNENIKDLFGSVEYKFLSEEELKDFLNNIKTLFEDEELVSQIHICIEKFNSIYEFEQK